MQFMATAQIAELQKMKIRKRWKLEKCESGSYFNNVYLFTYLSSWVKYAHYHPNNCEHQMITNVDITMITRPGPQSGWDKTNVQDKTTTAKLDLCKFFTRLRPKKS